MNNKKIIIPLGIQRENDTSLIYEILKYERYQKYLESKAIFLKILSLYYDIN